MRRRWVVVVAVLATGWSRVGAGDPVKDDLAKMQGTWVAIKGILDGKEIEGSTGVKLVFDGHKLTSGKGEVSTFTIDPTKKPKAIDLTPPGKKKITIPGIYQIDGDTLKLAFASAKGTGNTTGTGNKGGVEVGKRPTDFEGKHGSAVILKREK